MEDTGEVRDITVYEEAGSLKWCSELNGIVLNDQDDCAIAETQNIIAG